jgi:signal transduction histidine kinase
VRDDEFGESQPLRSHVPFMTALTLGLLVTFLLTGFLWRRAQEADQHRFDAAAHFIQERLDDRIEKYEQSLMLVRELFVDIPKPSETQWRQCLGRLKLEVNSPGLIEIGYAPWVLQDQLTPPPPALLAAISTNEALATNSHAAGLFMPVLYSSSSPQAHLVPVGSDLDTAEYGARIRNARDRIALALTGKTLLSMAGSPAPRFGVRLFQPVYDADLPVQEPGLGEDSHAFYLRALPERIRHFTGVVFGSVDIDLLLASMLENTVIEVALEIFDGTNPGTRHRVNQRVGIPLPGDLVRRLDITNRLQEWRMYGDRWALAFYPTEQFERQSPRRNLWIVLVAGLATTLGISGMVWVQSERRHAAEVHGRQLKEARDLVSSLSSQREQASRDLHDGVLQSLYSLGLGIQKTRKAIRRDPEEAEESCRQNLNALELAMGELRRHLAFDPSQDAGPLDLVGALQQISDSVNRHARVPIEFHPGPTPPLVLAPGSALQLLHIAREAIANAQRHSGASRVRLELKTVEQGVEMIIDDDGCGFDAVCQPRRGYGLRNMADRARSVGADFHLTTRPGAGTCVDVRLRSYPKQTPVNGKTGMTP